MSYLVLARKWRPKFFDEVVGQEHVARTLTNSIEQDRVHHAYLFCGARGVGKTSTARILAKCLNCAEGPTSEPCYHCNSCRDITEGQSVDVYEIDGASNRGINEIRELREGVRYAPSQGRFKVYIIDEVHMLTTEAFNALLKTLEEPPEHAYFIFATTEPQEIPITILSRCQRFDFKRISQTDIVDHLATICEEEGIETERAALQLMARQAEGAMRDALSLLDQVIGFAGDSFDEEEVADILGVANREHLFEISRGIVRRDAEEALGALDVVNRYGYDLQQFASELVAHLRDLTVAAAVDDPAGVTSLTESELEEAREQLSSMDVEGEARRQLLHRYFSVMADGAREMTRSPYPKLIFEMTLVRLTDLEPLVELDLLVDRLDALEQELGDWEDLPDSESPGSTRSPGGGAPTDGGADPAAEEPAAEAEPPGPAGADREGTDEGAAEDRSEDDEEDDEGEASGESARQSATGEQREPPAADDRPSPSERSGEAELEQRWRRVVKYVRERNESAAVKFEHAHPERFEEGRIELGCEPQYLSFFERPDHRRAIAEAAEELFGGEWEVEFETWSSDEAEKRETLADRREADRQRRREELERNIWENSVLQRAQSLFDLDEDDVRVDVEIDE